MRRPFQLVAAAVVLAAGPLTAQTPDASRLEAGLRVAAYRVSAEPVWMVER